MPVNLASSSASSPDSEQPSSLSPVSQRRLILDDRLPAPAATEGDQDAVTGLTQTPKSLPPKYFYDDRGSQLFEAITTLPEYYLTRTETQILHQEADAIARWVGACDLVELGSGSSTKTRILLDAYQRQNLPLKYVPVDVSGGILAATAQRLIQEYPTLSVHGLVSTYEAALADLPATDLPRRLIAFIGSTLGNLSPQACEQFFAQVSQALQPGDYFLLGIDLHKATAVLEAAYNDSQGVTAAFNLNMLHHLNWRFQSNFDPSQFRHVAFYNEGDRQMELYIESLCEQTITLKTLNLTVTFKAGERLLSEISRKFEIAPLAADLLTHGFQMVKTFTDDQQDFALCLCQRM
jgi:L-histidine N-alpha-methyltransferase